MVKSQATRSRSQNRKIARDLLALRLDELANGSQSRTAVVGEYKKKRADSAAKKARRKYRKLAEEKEKEAALKNKGEGEEEEMEEWVERREVEEDKVEVGRERAVEATETNDTHIPQR